jgi:hypothetical protein
MEVQCNQKIVFYSFSDWRIRECNALEHERLPVLTHRIDYWWINVFTRNVLLFGPLPFSPPAVLYQNTNEKIFYNSIAINTFGNHML